MPFLASLPRLSLRPRLLGLGSLLAALACAAYLPFALAFAGQNHDYTIVGRAGFVVLLGALAVLAAWRF